MPGPVDPNLLRELLRITAMRESGNKDFRPNGQPVASPAGALYRMQVMPATARAPGFGVQPAAAQTPAEYNRVGEQYYGKMLGRYGNDPAKAWAAYHSGPGTVDRLQRTYGAGWQQHLGPEGRDYVSDNLSALRRIQPQAQTPAPLTAQAPAMPSPLDAAVAQSPAQAPDARPTFQTEDEMVKLYRERQANEDKQIALQRTKAELATQALMAKRKGLGAGDWFRLSAALAARTRSRGLGGVLENVSPVLADIADRNEQARTGREQALAQLGYERDKGELDIRAGGFDNRLQMLKAIAERSKPQAIRSAISSTSDKVINLDTGETIAPERLTITPDSNGVAKYNALPRGTEYFDQRLNRWRTKI